MTECIGNQSVQASTLNIVQRDLWTENKWISTLDEVKYTQAKTSKQHIYQFHPSTAGKVPIQKQLLKYYDALAVWNCLKQKYILSFYPQ